MKNHFRQIQAFKPDHASVDISQFESERTGMRVVLVQREGPIVEGRFMFATEIHDDSGAPHTLEHLCFMGSRNYKYKGLLDKLASRAYSYTNASTETDCTNYQLSTAGWDGFAQILPIYLEHLLFPTLTESAFLTEVHHIDGDGNDAGTVYSEMQNWENERDSLANLRLARTLYPEGSGYRYETGGLLGNLRILSNNRIKEFHKDMYQPRNLCLCVIGDADKDQLFKILNTFETGILEEVPSISSPFKRPWVDTESAVTLQQTQVEKLNYPQDDESMGALGIALIGPPCTDISKVNAIKIMLDYLCGTSVSKLNNILVEQEHLASDLMTDVELRRDSLVTIYALGIVDEKLEYVENRIMDILKEIASKPLDMDYMKVCIKLKIRVAKYNGEMGTHSYEEHVKVDHLYGDRDGAYLRGSLGSLQAYHDLEKWNESAWRSFLKQWFVDTSHVSVLASPSAQLAKEIQRSEENRVEEQRARFGEAGLQELAKKLESAKAENETPIPREIIEKFDIPGTQSIHFVSTTTARAGTARSMGKVENNIQRIVDRDDNKNALFLHFEHAKMKFVNINMTFSTSSIPVDLKPLLFIFAYNYYDSPIYRNGERIEFEEVRKGITEETAGHHILVGSWDNNAELLTITSLVEPEKYPIIIQKHKELLFDSIMDIERIRSAVKKLIGELPEQLRNGEEVTKAIDMLTHFSTNSNNRASNPLVASRYFKSVDKLLDSDPQVIVDRMERLRQCLFRISNMYIAVNGDVESLPHPVSAWDKLTEGAPKNDSELLPLDLQRDFLNEKGRNPGGISHIVPLASTDSSYALFTAKGIDSRKDPRWPAFLVAMEYLQITEGVLWVAIRGQGFAYGFDIQNNVDRGSIQFTIDVSPKVFSAYTASRDLIAKIASGDISIDAHDLEGAISTYVSAYAMGRRNFVSAGFNNFVNEIVRKLSKEESADLFNRVRGVTVDQVREVIKEIVLPVFDPQKADMVVVCAKIMAEDLKKQFEEAGFKPEVRTVKSFKDEYSLVEGEDSDDEDEDEDEDEDDDNDDRDDESESKNG